VIFEEPKNQPAAPLEKGAGGTYNDTAPELGSPAIGLIVRPSRISPLRHLSMHMPPLSGEGPTAFVSPASGSAP
jgi:hypothetical protein